MSMIGNFRVATDEVIEGLRQNPEAVIKVIYSEEEDALGRA